MREVRISYQPFSKLKNQQITSKGRIRITAKRGTGVIQSEGYIGDEVTNQGQK